jgi:hypothetical protein
MANGISYVEIFNMFAGDKLHMYRLTSRHVPFLLLLPQLTAASPDHSHLRSDGRGGEAVAAP